MRYTHRAAAGIAMIACTSVAQAATVHYTFTGTVSSVNAAAAGYPVSLAGLAAGDTFSGTLTYDAASPTQANTATGLPFGTATVYALESFGLSLNINGVAFDAWTGTPRGYVWDNKNPISSGSVDDGLEFLNYTTAGDTQFSLGNLLLPTSTFLSAALPSTSQPESLALTLRSAGSTENWFLGSLSGGLQIAAVPLPPGAWMFGSGLLGLAATAGRRRRTV